MVSQPLCFSNDYVYCIFRDGKFGLLVVEESTQSLLLMTVSYVGDLVHNWVNW